MDHDSESESARMHSMMDAKHVRDSLGLRFKMAGFRRGAASTWQLHSPPVMIAAGFWRGRYVPRLDIDVGFWLHQREANAKAAVRTADMYFSIGSIFPALRDSVAEALHLEHATQAALDQLSESIDLIVLPQLRAWSDLPTLAHDFRSGKLQSGLVTSKARTILEAERAP